jgi:hypothetical protein
MGLHQDVLCLNMDLNWTVLCMRTLSSDLCKMCLVPDLLARRYCRKQGMSVISLKHHLFFCGCESSSFNAREAHKLRVFDSRLLRRIFEQKFTGRWRK